MSEPLSHEPISKRCLKSGSVSFRALDKAAGTPLRRSAGVTPRTAEKHFLPEVPMSIQRLSIRMRAGVAALAFLAVPAALTVWTSPASAEPRPWHNPELVVQVQQTGQVCAERDGSWTTRSRCPVPTKTPTAVMPNKAQVEHEERLATVAPNKAQVEHEERVAAAG